MQSRIDIHTHLLPGIDDGCESIDQSLDCVRQLLKAGYTGAVCTPHMWANLVDNTPGFARHQTNLLQQAINDQRLRFTVWPGGELQLRPDAVLWMEENGVPTLGNSRCVLIDFWQPAWPDWMEPSFEWLQQNGYQPILAHPERMPCAWEDPQRLYDLVGKGVWLQGNLRALTGEDGIQADELVRQLLNDRLYRFMALDVHSPSCLPGRIDGLKFLANEFGEAALEYLTVSAPNEFVVAAAA